MKRQRAAKNADETVNSRNPERDDRIYQRVQNTKEERVRGLWTRFGVYYAQLNANDGKQYRYRLEHAEIVPQAVLAQQALKMKEEAGTLLPPSQLDEETEGTARDAKEGIPVAAPQDRTLEAVIKEYQENHDLLETKSLASFRRKNSSLKLWPKKYGARDMLEIKNPTLHKFAKWRTGDVVDDDEEKCEGKRKKRRKVSGRAIDFDVMALNHVFDIAREMELIPREHPGFHWTTLATAPSKDELLSPSQMDELVQRRAVGSGGTGIIGSTGAPPARGSGDHRPGIS